MAHLLSHTLRAAAIAGALALPNVAVAEAGLCDRAIVQGARTGGVPQDVLRSISLTETGRVRNGVLQPWPWAINREGKGHWFATRAEALAFARASVAMGRPSFDVGCFQINYRWHGHQFAKLEDMFDPETGAAYAARFLRGLQAETGDWSMAAGAYHSRTPHLAQRYRARFDRIRAGLDGRPLSVAEAPTPAPTRRRLGRKPLIIHIERTEPADRQADLRVERPDGVRMVRIAHAEPR